jgi:hypothetical protein
MKLSAIDISELLKLRTQIAALAKEEKELTDKIKDQMKEEEREEYAPRESPFKFVCKKISRSSVSWKDEWATLAEKIYGDRWVSKEQRLIAANQSPVVTLTIEPNTKYLKEN